MDLESLTESERNGALVFLDFVNRWFGGHQIFVRFLKQAALRRPMDAPIRVLDIGTGSGELLLAIDHWAASQNIPLQIIGLEPSGPTADYAREKTKSSLRIAVQTRSIWELDHNETFDFVFSNLVLHHIAEKDQPRFIQACRNHATRGLLICDLRRSWFNYFLVKLASWIWGNRVVRNDGPLSVRRALTLAEAFELLALAQLPLIVRKESWCRLSIGGHL